MKNSGIRYYGLGSDWIPNLSLDDFLESDKIHGIYGKSGRDYVPKEYLHKYQWMVEDTRV